MKSARAKRPFDPAAWARAQDRCLGGRPCTICADEDAAKACDEIGEVWATEKKPGISYRKIADVLREQFGVDLRQGAVRNHFVNHRPALYGRISRGG